MKTEIYWISGPWPGRLAIVPRPRGGDWLEDEIRFWRESGFDVIVSLLMQDEIIELGLEQEKTWCKDNGIRFLQFSVPDRGVPVSREALVDLIAGLEKDLKAGKNIAVHCRQGIGRSSLIAASLLISAGQEPEAAWDHISVARRCSVPDTVEQRDWVNDQGHIFNVKT